MREQIPNDSQDVIFLARMLLKEMVREIICCYTRLLLFDVLDLWQEWLIFIRDNCILMKRFGIGSRRSTINLLIAFESPLRNLVFGILLKSLIILVNLMPCIVIILGKLLHCLRLSDLELFLWEHVGHRLTLKGFNVLSLELLALGGLKSSSFSIILDFK